MRYSAVDALNLFVNTSKHTRPNLIKNSYFKNKNYKL